MKTGNVDRISTGIANLDAILRGGLPKDSVTLVGGAPGGGKTTLAMQICFENASPDRRVLYIQTLSEPATKTIRHMQPFAFFDEAKVGESIHFFDLGDIMRNKGLENATSTLKLQLKKVRPSVVVIDSFRVFEDLAGSNEELRKFTYEVAINLMVWDCAALLIGEFTQDDLNVNPLSSIVDGIIIMGTHESAGEDQRFIQVLKMRGTDHDRTRHNMVICAKGVEIYAPHEVLRRDEVRDWAADSANRLKVGIAGVDPMLGEGIPTGSSVLVGGMSGCGKSIFLLEAIYRGAKEFGERGLFFSFEETPERLRTVAQNLGWGLQAEIDAGRVEIMYVPQPRILIERDVQAIAEKVASFKPQRVAIDSLSLLLHKITCRSELRDKIFQLTTIVQRARAVGFLSSDIPSGSNQISRFGVEETLVDGVVLLSMDADPQSRRRFIEVYKLRSTDHRRGQVEMRIDRNGITVRDPG